MDARQRSSPNLFFSLTDFFGFFLFLNQWKPAEMLLTKWSLFQLFSTTGADGADRALRVQAWGAERVDWGWGITEGVWESAFMEEQKALHRYSGHTLLPHAWLEWEFSHHNLKKQLCDLCACTDSAKCSHRAPDLTLNHLQSRICSVALMFVLCLLLRWTISAAWSNGLCQTRGALLRITMRWL